MPTDPPPRPVSDALSWNPATVFALIALVVIAPIVALGWDVYRYSRTTSVEARDERLIPADDDHDAEIAFSYQPEGTRGSERIECHRTAAPGAAPFVTGRTRWVLAPGGCGTVVTPEAYDLPWRILCLKAICLGYLAVLLVVAILIA